MELEEEKGLGFYGRVILVTFACCRIFGDSSLLLSIGMGFERGFGDRRFRDTNEDGVGKRVGAGFTGAFIGIMAGYTGILAFVLVVKLVFWMTGIEIADIAFVEQWHE